MIRTRLAPSVDIIGHEHTRSRLTPDILKRGMFADLLTGLPKRSRTCRHTAHTAHYPAIRGPGVNPVAVSRIYEVIEKRAE